MHLLGCRQACRGGAAAGRDWVFRCFFARSGVTERTRFHVRAQLACRELHWESFVTSQSPGGVSSSSPPPPKHYLRHHSPPTRIYHSSPPWKQQHIVHSKHTNRHHHTHTPARCRASTSQTTTATSPSTPEAFLSPRPHLPVPPLSAHSTMAVLSSQLTPAQPAAP